MFGDLLLDLTGFLAVHADLFTSFGQVSIKPGLWTLDWTMDWTVDSLLDWELDLVTLPKVHYSTMVNSFVVIM